MLGDAVSKVSLIQDVDSAISRIKNGLSYLQTIDDANNHYETMMDLLSNGYEHLIKALLIILVDSNGGTKDDFDWSRQKGHNIQRLKVDLVLGVKEKSGSDVLKSDLDYIMKDEYLLKMIDMFTNYASMGRYSNIDTVFAKEPSDPIRDWKAFELDILRDKGLLEDYKVSNDYYETVIIPEITIKLEKFTRVLARMFTLAGLGEFAKSMTGNVKDFLYISDEELGTMKWK